MRLSITERLRPFSHTPGACCVLPGSSLRMQIFPTLIRIDNLSNSQKSQEITLSLNGPARNFTVQQDLEKGRIVVWGHYLEGYLRYILSSLYQEDVFAIAVEKCPAEGIAFSCTEKRAYPKDILIVNEKAKGEDNVWYTPPATDRLSLGSHRQQDWDLVCRRADLREIFPVWLRLGQLVPQIQKIGEEGTGALLLACREVIASKKKLLVTPSFLKTFQGAFEGIFSPRWMDTDYQGLGVIPPSKNFADSPLALLSIGAKLIRSLFISFEEEDVHLLPLLPPEFHCGRFLRIHAEKIGHFDLEWSKKTIRRMIIHSTAERQLNLSFQQGIKRFRLRNRNQQQWVNVGTPITIASGVQYFFDNFKR